MPKILQSRVVDAHVVFVLRYMHKLPSLTPRIGMTPPPIPISGGIIFARKRKP